MLEITINIKQTGLTAVLYEFLYVLDDFWCVVFQKLEVFEILECKEFHAMSVVPLSHKMFSISLMDCYFYSFSLILCTITRNYGIFDLLLLFDYEMSLFPLHFRQVCRLKSEACCTYMYAYIYIYIYYSFMLVLQFMVKFKTQLKKHSTQEVWIFRVSLKQTINRFHFYNFADF